MGVSLPNRWFNSLLHTFLPRKHCRSFSSPKPVNKTRSMVLSKSKTNFFFDPSHTLLSQLLLFSCTCSSFYPVLISTPPSPHISETRPLLHSYSDSLRPVYLSSSGNSFFGVCDSRDMLPFCSSQRMATMISYYTLSDTDSKPPETDKWIDKETTVLKHHWMWTGSYICWNPLNVCLFLIINLMSLNQNIWFHPSIIASSVTPPGLTENPHPTTKSLNNSTKYSWMWHKYVTGLWCYAMDHQRQWRCESTPAEKHLNQQREWHWWIPWSVCSGHLIPLT